jgi:hypothetical protein
MQTEAGMTGLLLTEIIPEGFHALNNTIWNEIKFTFLKHSEACCQIHAEKLNISYGITNILIHHPSNTAIQYLLSFM